MPHFYFPYRLYEQKTQSLQLFYPRVLFVPRFTIIWRFPIDRTDDDSFSECFFVHASNPWPRQKLKLIVKRFRIRCDIFNQGEVH